MDRAKRPYLDPLRWFASAKDARLPSAAVATATRVPGDIELDALTSEPRTLDEWLTTFHLVLAVIDPYTNESAWLLGTMGRVLETFRGADCRVAWLVTAGPDDAARFLGPWSKELLTLVDKDRTVVKALGLDELPALVHISQDLTVLGAAQGWQPAEWQDVTDRLGRLMSWSKPVLPAPGDPGPFRGSPATG